MQENARGKYESAVCARVMQGNTAEYRVMPGERLGVGAKFQGNPGE